MRLSSVFFQYTAFVNYTRLLKRAIFAYKRCSTETNYVVFISNQLKWIFKF